MLRPTLIYGAGDPHNGYGPNRFRRQAAKGEPITLFGEGEEKRDHVAVEDVARLAVRMLMHRSTGVLNAVTGSSTSFRDIARNGGGQFPADRSRSSRATPGATCRIYCTASSTSPNATRHSRFPFRAVGRWSCPRPRGSRATALTAAA